VRRFVGYWKEIRTGLDFGVLSVVDFDNEDEQSCLCHRR